MILADKIIRERKKLGLSQEELAEKMNVSRQAVSKWEGSQSMPDIEKLLQLSRLFGVTTDYLLKDEIENEIFLGETEEQSGNARENPSDENRFQASEAVVIEKSGFISKRKTVAIGASNNAIENKLPNVKTVTMEQADDFLLKRKAAARSIAIGTFLCILSVVPLFLLVAVSQSEITELSEDTAVALGLIIMFLIVAVAVGLFVYTGFKNSPYEFIEKEPFETEHGVTEMVKERLKAFSGIYARFTIIGIILCVLSPISFFIGAFFVKTMVLLPIMLIIAGIGVIFLILAGVRYESMEKLLKEGEYSEAAKAKKRNGIKGTVSVIYWLVVTAVYLSLLFLSDGGNGWGKNSWVVWPVAGVLFPAVILICGLIEQKENKNINS